MIGMAVFTFVCFSTAFSALAIAVKREVEYQRNK